jgi:ribokinase
VPQHADSVNSEGEQAALTAVPRAYGRVLVVGSLNADLVTRVERAPGPGETVTGSDLVVFPGGKSANQAAAIAKLGGDVRLLGCVGDDANGALLRESLRTAGVGIDHLQTLERVATGTAMITVEGTGENRIVVSPGANGKLTAAAVDQAEAFFDTAREGAVLTLCLEVPVAAVSAAARMARQRGVRVVLNLSPYRPPGADLLDLVDILVVNAQELSELTQQGGIDPLDDWSTVAEATRQAVGAVGPEVVVVTLGSAGVRTMNLATGDISRAIRAPEVTPVDTTGCGDAFLGALALRLSAGDSLQDACAFAVLAGAYAATGAGAQASYPSAVQLARWRP